MPARFGPTSTARVLLLLVQYEPAGCGEIQEPAGQFGTTFALSRFGTLTRLESGYSWIKIIVEVKHARIIPQHRNSMAHKLQEPAGSTARLVPKKD